MQIQNVQWIPDKKILRKLLMDLSHWKAIITDPSCESALGCMCVCVLARARVTNYQKWKTLKQYPLTTSRDFGGAVWVGLTGFIAQRCNAHNPGVAGSGADVGDFLLHSFSSLVNPAPCACVLRLLVNFEDATRGCFHPRHHLYPDYCCCLCVFNCTSTPSTESLSSDFSMFTLNTSTGSTD